MGGNSIRKVDADEESDSGRTGKRSPLTLRPVGGGRRRDSADQGTSVALEKINHQKHLRSFRRWGSLILEGRCEVSEEDASQKNLVSRARGPKGNQK